MAHANTGRKKPYLPYPTQQELRENFYYQPNAGGLVWLKSRGNRACSEQAGSRTQKYPYVTLNGVMHNTRSLVWIYHHGSMPPGGLRSIDGDAFNTRIENLEPRRKPKLPTVSFL